MNTEDEPTTGSDGQEGSGAAETDERASGEVSRRTFVAGAVGVGGLLALLPVLGESSASAGVPSAGGPRSGGSASVPKILKSEITSHPDGDEVFLTLETIGADGNPSVGNYLGRRVDSGATYVIFLRVSVPGSGSSHTKIVSGRKGEVEGDYRWDSISTTTMFDDGTVNRSTQARVKVLTVNPYPGLSPQDMAEQFARDKASGRWQN